MCRGVSHGTPYTAVPLRDMERASMVERARFSVLEINHVEVFEESKGTGFALRDTHIDFFQETKRISF